MKSGSRILASAAFFLLLAGLLCLIINACCFDRNYYIRQYSKDDAGQLTGMDQEDLMKSTDALLDYLQDKRDDIEVYAVVNGMAREVYSKREKLHMVDVKALYQNFLRVTYVMLASGGALLCVSLAKAKGRRVELLRRGYDGGASILLVLLAFLSIWALADFDAFWWNFHLLFFPNNTYWQMDPNVSIMINMFPGDFWFDLVMKIILIFALCLAALWFLLHRIFRRGKSWAM